jgi:hypothetical protein
MVVSVWMVVGVVGWMETLINIVHVHSLTIRKKCIYVFPGKKYK